MIKARFLFIGSCVFCFGVLLGSSPTAAGQALEKDHPLDSGIVSRVSDGDTIQVRLDDGTARRVRLIGVDTPERDDRRENERYWAEVATRFVVYQLLDKKIRLSYDGQREDRYGRTLAYVWTGGGELFNERLILGGFSAAYLTYQFRRDYEDLFRKAEDRARREGQGRWRRQAPPILDLAAARGHLGEYVSVRFRCGSIAAGRKYFFLWTTDKRFQVLASNTIAWPQPAATYFQGKDLVATGILEEQKGLLRMYVFFAGQISRL